MTSSHDPAMPPRAKRPRGDAGVPFLLSFSWRRPVRRAGAIRCPILLVVAEHDAMAPVAPALRVGNKAPRGALSQPRRPLRRLRRRRGPRQRAERRGRVPSPARPTAAGVKSCCGGSRHPATPTQRLAHPRRPSAHASREPAQNARPAPRSTITLTWAVARDRRDRTVGVGQQGSKLTGCTPSRLDGGGSTRE